MTAAESMLSVAIRDLNAAGVRWALIGGLAVSVRTEYRYTKDVDFAVAVADDAEADAVVFRLKSSGYLAETVISQKYIDRLSTVRLTHSKHRLNVIVDLLFASTGIEQEIVAAATPMKVLPRVRCPVATIGHLIAMKILAHRPQDLADLDHLIAAASPADLGQARAAVALIRERGFSPDRDIAADLDSCTRTDRV